MKIVNLTPHPLVFQRTCPYCLGQVCEDARYECQQGTISDVIPSSGVARCSTTETVVDEINGIPVIRTTFGAVEGLPDAALDTVYVVSSITAQAVPHRTDVFVPSRPVRDSQGRIVACTALGRIA
jgi:hypothetical protein